MFRPEEMVKLDVITLNRYKDELLTYLHEVGLVEIRELDVKVAQKDAPNEYHRKAASYSITISRLADFLKAHKKSTGGGIKEFFFPKEKAKRTYRYEGIEKLIKDVEEFLSKVEPEIKEVETKLSSLQSEKIFAYHHIIAFKTSKIAFYQTQIVNCIKNICLAHTIQPGKCID